MREQRTRQREVAAAVRHKAAMIRQQAQTQKEKAQTQKEMDKYAKEKFYEERFRQASSLQEISNETLENFKNIINDTLLIDDTINFDSLRLDEKIGPFVIPENLLVAQPKPKQSFYTNMIAQPKFFASFWPGTISKYKAAVGRALEHFEDACRTWAELEKARLKDIADARLRHGQLVEELNIRKNARDAEVDEFRDKYLSGDVDAIVSYNSMVLEQSMYPEGFPQKFSVAYTEASRQIVIEYELPTVSIIPVISEYTYMKSKDLIIEKQRKPADIRSIYQDVIASISLRTIHEIFEADQGKFVDVLCFNGYIHTCDPATGRDIKPYLISVRTTKEQFNQIDLRRIDKIVCMKNLGAQVSRHPDEAQPVRPIVDFEMADARFVDQSDLISGLSSATNLMDLNPYEFEQLVANTFAQMGLESRLTRSSRDGGVDCIAFDRRPILGGKVVIQAKRYRHTVGVSAVRDLYGTMMNEGANKGILVTTSGYGPDAFQFAKDKPIELIDGGGLLFLLQEIGVEARIIFPEDNA